ncbi:MAG: hypothetical protein K2I03_04365 [Lachnospiraceae bacterium]|nr:hypothetical protein [Lachnospiraceae bacterium]
MELADFFHTSVDVLLGYEWEQRSMGECAQHISSLRSMHQYGEGIKEARKALKQYPNSFKEVYESGEMLYMAALQRVNFLHEDEWDEVKRDMDYARRVLERALDLFEQNTDRHISRELIRQEIGMIYGFVENKKKAISYLEEQNPFHIHDCLISQYLCDLKEYDKAWSYVIKYFRQRLADIRNCFWTIYEVLLVREDYDEALFFSEWMKKFCLSAAEMQNSYFYRAAAIADALRATVYAYKSVKEEKDYSGEIRKVLKTALTNAYNFDIHTAEYEVYDSFGRSVLAAIKNAILCSKDDEEQFEYLKEIYNGVAKDMKLDEIQIPADSQ